jgi:hypothetical protein
MYNLKVSDRLKFVGQVGQTSPLGPRAASSIDFMASNEIT